MDYLSNRTVGLDGVPAQQKNYEMSGFVWAGRNIRYTGVVSDQSATADPVVAKDERDVLDLIGYDRRFFAEDRNGFLRSWLQPNHPTRHTMLCRRDGHICGYGTIRRCRAGYKIGPLFADDDDVAKSLFAALSRVAGGSSVNLDVPELNRCAVNLAEACGLSPSFETARMYRGSPPDLPVDRIFGITTFELG